MYQFHLFNPSSKKNKSGEENIQSSYSNIGSTLEANDTNSVISDDMDTLSDFSDSDTSKESWVNEVIYVRGEQFMLSSIDTRSRELEDFFTKRRFFLSKICELYYNKIGLHADSLKTSAELAVCGGKLYALLMGEAQPIYFVGVRANDEDDEDNYYLISTKVDFIAQEKEIFGLNKPIVDLITSLIISYFLGDFDISNIGVVQGNNNVLQVVRFDPEFCFSSYFIGEHNTYEMISKELRFIFNLDLGPVPEERANRLRQILQRRESNFFARCFAQQLLWEPAFLDILSSPRRKEEIFKALDRITTTLFMQYRYIIDTTISHEKTREALKNTLTRRREIFSQISGELKLHSQVFLAQHIEKIKENEMDDDGFCFTIA